MSERVNEVYQQDRLLTIQIKLFILQANVCVNKNHDIFQIKFELNCEMNSKE